MDKQVDATHYNFTRYVSQRRWASIWHQISETLAANPQSVLELGPGPGIFSSIITKLGIYTVTSDIDPELHPDLISDSANLPFADQSFDAVCAFQVLEHMPFEKSLLSIREMARVARKSVVISLPDAKTCWPITLPLPGYRRFEVLVPKPFHRARPHKFNGEHYWEVSKLGFLIKNVLRQMEEVTPSFVVRTFRVHENPYHRFFILKRSGS